MDALIVGNRPLSKNIIELSRNKLIVAADGGADRLLEYEILPDKVIGDLDSISDKTATKLEDWLILNKDIQLFEPCHKYILSKNPDIKFQSVTEIIGGYFEPFDNSDIQTYL